MDSRLVFLRPLGLRLPYLDTAADGNVNEPADIGIGPGKSSLFFLTARRPWALALRTRPVGLECEAVWNRTGTGRVPFGERARTSVGSAPWSASAAWLSFGAVHFDRRGGFVCVKNITNVSAMKTNPYLAKEETAAAVFQH